MAERNILIIDDDVELRETVSSALTVGGYRVEGVESGEEGLSLMGMIPFEIILCDLKLPDMSGIDVLSRITERTNSTPVIVITGHTSVDNAVEAMKLGASDYLKKPFKIEELRLAIENVIEARNLVDENRYLKRELASRNSFGNLLGKSKRMREIFDILEKVAPAKVTVLLEGESGTGKEVVAKAIHLNSPRRDRRLMVMNCSALPETLLESELFGHIKGAFTGADQPKKGLLDLADGGTVFLDEIANAPLSIQVKLLRVLEDSTFTPLGGTEPIEVDLRVIAASNIDLKREVERGAFREDLFYRLNVLKIVMPPLRERKEDIAFLAQEFLKKTSEGSGERPRSISKEAMIILENYNWPGNVRELENVMQYALAIAEGPTISPEDLPKDALEPIPLRQSLFDLPLRKAKRCFEREYILKILRKTKGNVSKSAQLARIARQNLHQKLKRYGIKARDFW